MDKDELIETLIKLNQNHESHIDILVRIIKHIGKELELANICYKHKDYEEMYAINCELIEFIKELTTEEENENKM